MRTGREAKNNPEKVPNSVASPKASRINSNMNSPKAKIPTSPKNQLAAKSSGLGANPITSWKSEKNLKKVVSEVESKDETDKIETADESSKRVVSRVSEVAKIASKPVLKPDYSKK